MFFPIHFKAVLRRIMFGLILFSMICTAIDCGHTSMTVVSSASENIIYWDVMSNTIANSQVHGLSGVVAIASGTRLDVAFGLDYGVALKSDGTVWSWDEMAAGSQFNNAEAVQISGLSNITAIATGFGNSLALDSTGNVWAWGNNDFGQFGIGITGGGDQPQGTTTMLGTTPPSLIPQPVQVTSLNNVKAVSDGLRHCLALKTDSTVWAWGYNDWGQLGDGTTTNHYVPTQVNNLNGVIAISAGDYHSLALKSDGTVWAWGDDESGELGDGTTSNSYIPVQVKELNKITAIAAGEAHNLALKSDGTVWSWGNNENGQAGNGTQNSTANPGVVTPVQVQNLKNVVDIAEGRMPGGGPDWDGGTVKYGEGYCMVLKSDGTIWDWGDGGYPTETSFKSRPVQVSGLSGVKVIAAGSNYAIAIVANTTVLAATTATTIGSTLNSQPVEVVSGLDTYKTDETIIPGEPNIEITLRQSGIPFFTATNTVGDTALPSEALGCPMRLAYDKTGAVRFSQTGRPVIRVAKELFLVQDVVDKTGGGKLGKTIVEKILAKAAGKKEVSPGEYVEVAYNNFIQVSSDGGGTPMPDTFGKYGWDKLWDPTKVMIVPDHCGSYTPTNYGSDNNNRENHRRNSEWARKMGVPEENILDLGRVGNCHHLGVEEGWALPGSIYLHGDTHAMTVGGVGCFGPCVSAFMAALLRTGLMWFRVPESIKFNITGKLQDGVMGRDVYEYILGQIGPAGAIYQVMEFTGPVMDEMSMDGRLSMCCLAIFAGAKMGIVNPDKKVLDWFKARTKVPFEPQVSDSDAEYVKTFEYDGAKIEPQIVVPPLRHTVKNISEVEGIKVTSAFIGSCASGRDEDMRIAAKILKGRKVHPGVMFNITPGTSAAMMRAAQEGVIATLLEAGCFVCAPGCGMCPGYYTPLTKNEVCITSSTTNYPGRMGDESAQVYLGSPATVAASALEGKITDPRKYL